METLGFITDQPKPMKLDFGTITKVDDSQYVVVILNNEPLGNLVSNPQNEYRWKNDQELLYGHGCFVRADDLETAKQSVIQFFNSLNVQGSI